MTEGEKILKKLPADAEVVPKDLFEQYKYERDVAIDQLHSYGVELGAEKELVEVRHGEWVNIVFSQKFRCSLCGQEVYFGRDKYCNACGAKMDASLKKLN